MGWCFQIGWIIKGNGKITHIGANMENNLPPLDGG